VRKGIGISGKEGRKPQHHFGGRRQKGVRWERLIRLTASVVLERTPSNSVENGYSIHEEPNDLEPRHENSKVVDDRSVPGKEQKVRFHKVKSPMEKR